MDKINQNQKTFISFVGYDIKPYFYKTDGSYRIEINISKDQNEECSPIILRHWDTGSYKITIEPIDV